MAVDGELRDRIIGLQRKRDYRGAIALVEEGLALRPGDPFLLGEEVFLLLRLGRAAEARRRAEERLDVLGRDRFFLKTYVSVLTKLKAAADLEAFIDSRLLAGGAAPDEDVLVFACRSAASLVGTAKAAGFAERALALLPRSRALAALVAELRGREPPVDEPGRCRFYRERFSGKKPAEAIAEIESLRALPKMAGDRALLKVLAEMYKKEGNFAKAAEVYRAVLVAGDELFTRKMLGFVLYRLGDADGALACLGPCFVADPGDAVVRRAVFSILKKRGDREGLEKLVREAVGAHPEATHLLGLLQKARRWKESSGTS